MAALPGVLTASDFSVRVLRAAAQWLALYRRLVCCAGKFQSAQAMQSVRDLRQEECRASVRITDAAEWLAGLAA
jgi:hypothetical protein